MEGMERGERKGGREEKEGGGKRGKGGRKEEKERVQKGTERRCE